MSGRERIFTIDNTLSYFLRILLYRLRLLSYLLQIILSAASAVRQAPTDPHRKLRPSGALVFDKKSSILDRSFDPNRKKFHLEWRTESNQSPGIERIELRVAFAYFVFKVRRLEFHIHLKSQTLNRRFRPSSC